MRKYDGEEKVCELSVIVRSRFRFGRCEVYRLNVDSVEQQEDGGRFYNP